MSMLKPFEILTFASTSKGLMKAVTYKHVMSSALVAEKVGYYNIHIPKKKDEKKRKFLTLKDIMASVELGNVLLPTPMRLLRLVCGRKCEWCLEHQTIASQSLLLSFCHECGEHKGLLRFCPTKLKPVKFLSTGFHGPSPDEVVVDHDFVAKEVNCYDLFPLNQPFSARSGERVGPVVSVQEMETLLKYGKDFSDHKVALQDVPGFPNEEAIRGLKLIFDETKTGCKNLDAELELKALIKTHAVAERNSGKREKIEKAIDSVKGLLDENWREFALVFTWNREYRGFPKFVCDDVHSIMMSLVRAFTKITQENIEKAAEDVNNGFRTATDAPTSNRFYHWSECRPTSFRRHLENNRA